MNPFLEILKYVLPSLVVLAAAYFIIRLFFEKEQNARLDEIRRTNAPVITPIRLQAYERIVLFLERIMPGSLIIRMNQQGLNSLDLQRLLVQSIREEYEHNLSQQVYVSPKAWDLVRNAKEEMITLIKTAAASVHEDAPSTDLAQKIFEKYLSQEKSAPEWAIDFIKKEIAQIF
jgi:hypothetical protein